MLPCSSVKSHQVKKRRNKENKETEDKKRGKFPKCNILMGKIIGELSLSQDHSLLPSALGLPFGVFSCLGRITWSFLKLITSMNWEVGSCAAR